MLRCLLISIPRHKDLISNYNESHNSESLEGISDPEPQQVPKSERGRITKNFGSDFQLYLVEGYRDEVGRFNTLIVIVLMMIQRPLTRPWNPEILLSGN